MDYNYFFTGDNPEYCAGLVVESQSMYILPESMSSAYTSTGSTDSIIITLDIYGKPIQGKYLTMGSTQRLGNGLFRMKDGSFVYSGNTKKVNGHNFYA